MTLVVTCSSSGWTREQDRAFENALATHPEYVSNRWERIATDVPGKTLEEIRHHYEILVDDVSRIESGFVPLPSYSSDSLPSHAGDEGTGKKGDYMGHHSTEYNRGSKVLKSDQERRKGIAWTEDEHRLFLLGLEKYGKGDWRSISRNFVVTRTPTQVASHAQKYFIRLNSINKDRRRSSIHDITSVGSGDVSAPLGTITGLSNGFAPRTFIPKPNKLSPPQHPDAHPGVGIYAPPTIGQQIGGPFVSAVGTPVNLPSPAHMTYGTGALVPGAIPGAVVPAATMAYPMLPRAAHR